MEGLIAGRVTIQVQEEWIEERAAEHGKVNIGGPGGMGGGVVQAWRTLMWPGRFAGGRKCLRTRRMGGWSIDW